MEEKKTPFFANTYEPESEYNQKRYRFTLQFIENLSGDVLDCGEPNLLRNMMEEKFKVSIQGTVGDLDIEPLSGQYDYVTAFEIIEHLMNPLWFLRQIHSVLKPEGRLYLSTPINKPKYFWRHDHFHEFDEYRLGLLIERAGFEVVRKERKRFYKINGIRPIFRVLFKTGTLFLELRPAKR